MRTAAGLVLDLHNLMLNPGRREAWLDRIFAETRAGLCAVFRRRAPVPGLLGSARRAIHEQYGRGRGAELS